MSRAKQDRLDLFSRGEETSDAFTPLADRLRPLDFEEFVGQEEIVAPDRPLRRAIEADTLTSAILWGPPGTGKTSLASIIARRTKAEFVMFPAVTSGLPELRAVIKVAEQRRALSHQRTILFVDEIHRFNKAQQDGFLPHVERGTIILLGATTENPSFEVIAPLLSRSMVVVLKPIPDDAMSQLIDRAVTDTERGLGKWRVALSAEARQRLIGFGNGDARAMLTALEFVVSHTPPSANGQVRIDDQAMDAALLKKALRYDRAGEEHYNLISAYIKSLRDSDPDGALYWLARMVEGGEDPRFIARRMVIFASEDIGNANPLAVVIATAVAQAVEFVGLPEAQINLGHGTTYLASCSKDNASYVGIREAMQDARTFGNLEVPLHLRNAVTSLMRDVGYGKGYRYVHEDPAAKAEQAHLPNQLKGKRYYRPKTL
ncbi:MAG: replication-associated recombination protein A [Nitrospiraceae bacterium]